MRPAITFLNIQLSNSRVLREYQVETTEDMEKLDFEWCLRQVLKLAV